MPTISIKDAAGTTQTVEVLNPNGRAAAASSRPVTLSSEDFAQLIAARPVQAQVVTGDQSYTIGSNQIANMTPNGRWKVSVSNAGNLNPAAQLATTTTADLVGMKYYATRPTWADGYTGTMQSDINGNLLVIAANLVPTAGTNLGGTVTTTSGGFNIPANTARRPGDIQGQNTGANPIAFNEFGGTAVIGGTTANPTGDANSYVVPPQGTFSISTTNLVNFIALTGSSTVAITRIS